jgi:hypothetical protein
VIAVISSIKSTVTIVKALATVAVVIVVASGLLGGRWDSKGHASTAHTPSWCAWRHSGTGIGRP